MNMAPDITPVPSRSQSLTPLGSHPRIFPLHPLHPYTSDWPAGPLCRRRSENLHTARRISIRKKWHMTEMKVMILTIFLRGRKKKAKMCEGEHMLQGLLRAQENMMSMREMARIFHPPKLE